MRRSVMRDAGHLEAVARPVVAHIAARAIPEMPSAGVLKQLAFFLSHVCRRPQIGFGRLQSGSRFHVPDGEDLALEPHAHPRAIS